MFEDSVNGINAAKSAGFYTIGIGKTGALSIADAVIPNFRGFNFKEMLNLLKFNLASTN